jgi:phospholipid transport system substrate-binding protein
MKRICFYLLFSGLAFNSFAKEVASTSITTVAASKPVSATKDAASKPATAAKEFVSGVIVDITQCEPTSPCGVVSDTTKKVLEAVNKGVPKSKTANLINTAAAPQFDFNLMTRYAMGNNWKLASNDEQNELVDLFKELLIYTYSTALSKFKGAQITLTNSTIDGKKPKVITQVLLPSANPNAQPIKVEYDLAKVSEDASWKAYDIKIENASLITTYRNQFNEVVQSDKIEGLIKQLQTKVNALKAKNT